MLSFPATLAATPPTVSPSVSNVPSISALPEISNVAASNSPEIVRFLPPVKSLLLSTITALLAETVPAVMPSTKFNSAAVDVTAAEPKVN